MYELIIEKLKYFLDINPKYKFLIDTDQNKIYNISKFKKAKNLNFLQKLILISNIPFIKKILIENIKFFTIDDINYQNSKKWTALMMASRNSNHYSNETIVKLLLDNGANVNLKNDKGWDALLLSCRNSSCDSTFNTVKMLIEHGADIQSKNNLNQNALMLSANYIKKESNLETVKYLLEMNVNLDQVNIYNENVIMICSRNTEYSSSTELLKILLEYKYDSNFIDKYGNYILFNVLDSIGKYSNIETLELLLKSNFDVNHKNNYGVSVFTYACHLYNENIDVSVLKLLLDYGADINSQDDDGYTVLMHSIEININLFKFLLDKNPDLSLLNYEGMNILMLCCEKSHKINMKEYVQLLLNFDINIDTQDVYGWTSLMIVCRNCNLYNNEIAKLLYEKGIDCNLYTNDGMYNALMLLTEYNSNQYELAKLLRTKTNLSHRNINNNTIDKICRIEYLDLFIKKIEELISNYSVIKSECLICVSENIDCIVCNYGHHTCFECIKKSNGKCEACQLFL